MLNETDKLSWELKSIEKRKKELEEEVQTLEYRVQNKIKIIDALNVPKRIDETALALLDEIRRLAGKSKSSKTDNDKILALKECVWDLGNYRDKVMKIRNSR